MNNLIRVLAAVSAAGTVLAIAPAANSANYLSSCQLSGAAHFDKSGLEGPPTYGPISYSFQGQLSGCQSSDGGPASGSVFAGQQGLNHPAGAGDCAETVSNGESVVKWLDGNYTVIDYGTQGVLAGVELNGTVVQATTETDPTTGQPLFTTNEASTPVGSTVGGVLVFQPSNPQQCGNFTNQGPAVTDASISGVIGAGEGPQPLPSPPQPPQLPPLPPPPIDVGPLQ